MRMLVGKSELKSKILSTHLDSIQRPKGANTIV